MKAGVTCKNPATYYYSCECGKKGTRIFYDGKALPHDFTAEVIADQYEIKKATCFEEGEYYKSCVCGAKGHDWARESGLYQTVEEYNAAMNSWNRAGKVMFFVMLGLIAFYILFFVFIFGMVGLSLNELY